MHSLSVLSIQFSIVASLLFFFFNDTATTEIYTLSLHDALPISGGRGGAHQLYPREFRETGVARRTQRGATPVSRRSEEHTSELQSQSNLVCRLLLEKKKKVSQKSSYHIHVYL